MMSINARKEVSIVVRNSVILAIAVAVATWMSLTYTRATGSVSTMWIPSGILCGLLLTSRKSRWPVFIAVAFAVNLFIRIQREISPSQSITLAIAGTFEAWFVATCVIRYAGSATNQEKIALIGTVATASTIVACIVSGVVAASTLLLVAHAKFLQVLATWLTSHVLGMVVFATLTVVGLAQGKRLLGSRERRLEYALTMLLIATTATAVFSQTQAPLLFAVFPVMLLAAFRHGFGGVIIGVTVTSVIAMLGTFSGNGPLLLNPLASAEQRTLVLQLFIACMCLTTLPVGVVLARRRWLERRLAASESDYRMLADYSRDMVVRIDAQGRRKYISPAATEILGWPLDELREERWDLIHPDDVADLMVVISKLRVEGGRTTAVYRVQHRDGHYIWIEAHARLVPSSDPTQASEIIYAGRDISRRIKAEHDLARNQRRLRSITDNTPAFVVHINTEERYTFANAYTGKMLGVHPAALVGRSMREVAGDAIYAEIKPYIHRALRGETVTFETERKYADGEHSYQCTYIPDRTPEGDVVGFYGMIFDISNMKNAERALAKLARNDSLTGLANRFQFNERLGLAVVRRHRKPAPIALLYLDVDHFKDINDTMGHAAGDALLIAFAHRLRECVRETDLVARLGGDEFVVLIEDLDSAIVAERIARKLIDKLAEGITLPEGCIAVTTSIGIAYRADAVKTGDELMKLADDALYAAKAGGRNTFRVAQ
ncbi:MAG TPA: diguanylate cyclase [Rudaea sp.]|jgi:diguanylate cyclase (GGDEF)-like protein/PAS domain S-box-containing protein|nr:diguanylate cyclase [Rudaea sp.]